MAKREDNKTLLLGKMQLAYPERLPKETYFIRFPKPGRIQDNTTE